MAKRGKMSKVETFFILQNKDLSVAELAKELDRTEDSVTKVRASALVEDIVEGVEAEVVEEAPAKDTGSISRVYDGPTQMQKLMGRRTGGQRRGGVSIMTPAASQLADDTRGQRVGHAQKAKDAIFQPYGEEDLHMPKEEE
jgi:hypothetical protein